jgi:hypothetical protein
VKENERELTQIMKKVIFFVKKALPILSTRSTSRLSAGSLTVQKIMPDLTSL